MQHQPETDELGFCLSFSCYFSDSLTASAAAKVICELKQEQAAQFYEFSDVDEKDFEFSPDLSDERVSGKQVDDFQFIFSGFDTAVVEIGDAGSPIKSSVDEDELLSSSFSSSEAEELIECDCKCKPSGIFCIWRSKADVVSSVLTECKKSNSTGKYSGSRGSRRWRIWNSVRRSNSEGEESVINVILRSNKKNDDSKQRREHAGKVKTTSSASATASPSFHELFYVKKRAEQKGDKLKSFLPYKQDLLGFFVNINRSGKKKSSF